MKYKVVITSNFSLGREYETDSRSALKAAEQYGRFEGGEVVTVCNKSGRVIDKAVFTPEDGGKYVKVAL